MVFTIEYSFSYDPVRFSDNGTTKIGTIDDWTKVAPDDFTKVKAFKVSQSPHIAETTNNSQF